MLQGCQASQSDKCCTIFGWVWNWAELQKGLRLHGFEGVPGLRSAVAVVGAPRDIMCQRLRPGINRVRASTRWVITDHNFKDVCANPFRPMQTEIGAVAKCSAQVASQANSQPMHVGGDWFRDSSWYHRSSPLGLKHRVSAYFPAKAHTRGTVPRIKLAAA